MYLPQHFSHADRALAVIAMRENPFAILISSGADNEPFATHAPLAVDERDGALVIVGHIARANPHSQLIGLGEPLLAIFSGPHAYISPSNYDARESVPTWNYIAVHAYGEPRLITDPVAKDASQKRLIADHEPEYAAHWRSLDPGYQAKMLEGITVFEIPIRRLEAKFKLIQNRSEGDRRRVYDRQRVGSHDERGLAQWMERVGAVPPNAERSPPITPS